MVVSRPASVYYPSSDGKPIAENTIQYDWIATIKAGLDRVFFDRRDVFVAADLLWYPIEGDPKTCVAPDVMVAFGRPRGPRMSYLQFREDNVPPQVVFEILSQSNTKKEMEEKRQFYETHGVEEFYIYDPYRPALEVYLQKGEGLNRVLDFGGVWTSPRLGIRMELTPEGLVLFHPDNERFMTIPEIYEAHDLAWELRRQDRRLMNEERDRANLLQEALEDEQQRAEAERQRAEAERQKSEQATLQLQAMRERLRAMGIDPDALN